MAEDVSEKANQRSPAQASTGSAVRPDAAEFIEYFRSDIIRRLSNGAADSIADDLLKEFINDEDYARIINSATPHEKVRALYEALKPGKPNSYSEFYKILKKKHKHLFEDLEAGEKNKTRKRKPISSISEDQVVAEKRQKAEDQPAAETKTGHKHGQGAKNETDAAFTPDFRCSTLSQMLEYIEDPAKRESMIISLQQKLGDKEMKNLENSMKGHDLKSGISFNDEVFKRMYSNQELTTFLKPGKLAKYPTVVFNQLFVKIKGFGTVPSNYKSAAFNSSAIQKQDKPQSNPKETANESTDNVFIQNSAGHTANDDPHSLIPVSPRFQNMITETTGLPLTTAQSTANGTITKESFEREKENLSTAVEGTSTDNADSAHNTVVHDVLSQSIQNSPQEANRKCIVPCSGTPTTPSEDCLQSGSEQGTTTDEGSHDILYQNNGPHSPTTTSSGVQDMIPKHTELCLPTSQSTPYGSTKDDVSRRAKHDANTDVEDTVTRTFDSGYNTTDCETSLSIQNSPQEINIKFIAPCSGTPTSPSEVYPHFSPVQASATNEQSHGGFPHYCDSDSSVLTSPGVQERKAKSTAQSTPSDPTINKVSEREKEDSSTAVEGTVPPYSDSDYNSADHKTLLSTQNSPQEAPKESKMSCPDQALATPSEGYSQSNCMEAESADENKRKRKGPDRLELRARKMSFLEYQRDILLKWAMKRITFDQSGNSQEEKLKKIKDSIKIVRMREHPRYPLLLVYNCMVFQDPQTQQCKIIEIPSPNKNVLTQKGKLKSDADFKLQFHMWLLGISEAVVLLENGEEKMVCSNSGKEFEERYKDCIEKVVVPGLAVFQKVQRDSVLF